MGYPPRSLQSSQEPGLLGSKRRRPPGSADQLESSDRLTVVVPYPDTDLLRSGWLLGENVLTGEAAVVELQVEREGSS